MHQHIVIIGFMGTGKTTVGEMLAKKLGRPLVDTDRCIEEQLGKRIRDLFETEGERYFRQREHDVLTKQLTSQRPSVITTGGGIVLRLDNVQLMKHHGWVVNLTADRQTLIDRLKCDSSRPLLTGDLIQRIDRLLHERRNAYDFAHLHIDTSQMTPAQVAERIKQVHDQWSEGDRRMSKDTV